jgi:hypothetical protein
MSPLEREAPPVGEEIHLPGPSVQPVLLTLGVTALLVGVTTTRILLWAGLALSLVVIVRWIRDVRHDVDELPLEHTH